MAEFNPYKLEEEKWTPKNVYEILPPNAVSWSDYDFGQGTDNVDQEAASKSFIDGFVDFFSELLGTAGQILGGAIELGGAIFSGFVNGVSNLIGGIANAIGSIFGGPSESPYPPMFSPIKANLEAAVQPFKDQIQDSYKKSEDLLAEQLVIRGEIAEQVEITKAAVEDAKAASERSGEAIGRAEAASAAAREARETLEEYNTELKNRITKEFNIAVGRANTAVDRAETIAGELADFKTQASADVEDALTKAQAANDELAALSPQIDEAASNASAAVDKAEQTLEEYTAWAAAQKARIDTAVSKAEQAVDDLAALSPQVADAVEKSAEATDKVATLTPKVTDAVNQAGSAVDTANQTLSEYTAWSKAQKTRIDTAVSKAEAATANVATLSPQVADAVAKSEAATGNVATLTPQVSNAVTQASAAVDKADQTLAEYTAWAKNQKTRIDSAVSKAETATANVATLTPKVTDAVSKANKASSDVSSLTPKVSAAQTKADEAYTEAEKVRSEVTPKIEAAQTKGETALASADKAIAESEFVAGFADDLVPKNSAGKSTWSKGLASVDASPEESAFGSERTFLMDNSFTFPEAFEPVKGQEVYRLTVWVYRDPDTSSGAFSFHVVDEDGQRRWVEARLDLGPWRSLDTHDDLFTTIGYDAWEKHTLDFRWPENLGPARIRFQMNAGNAFYLHDPQVRVIQPLDNSVDIAQNETLRAHSEILRQQDEINEAQRVANEANNAFIDNQKKWNQAVDRSIETQDTVNENFKIWTDGAAEAIEANKNAIAALNAPQIGTSIIPLVPGTKIPVWQYHLSEVAKSESSSATAALPEGVTHIYRAPGSQIPAGNAISVTIPDSNVVMVDPTIEYEASWWTYSTSGSGRYAHVTLEDDTGNGYVVEKTDDEEASEYTSGNPVRAIITPVTNTWTKYTTRFRFKEGTQFVRFSMIHFSNERNSSDSYHYIADLHIGPKIPNQAQVDDAQNKAIESLKIFAEKQEDWNEGTKAALATQETVNENFKIWTDGAAEAIEANKNAIAALNAPQIGTSIIPIVPKTEIPVWQYHLRSVPRAEPRDADLPEGIHTIYRHTGNTIAAGENVTVNIPNSNVVMVDSTVEYEASWWARASAGRARHIYVTLEDETGNTHVIDTLPEGSDYTSGNPVRAIITPATTEWTHYTTRFKFKPGVQFIRFSNIYFGNDLPSSRNAYLYIADLHIGPKIPTQAQVDDAQDKAIESLRIFAENQEDWNDGTAAALATQETVDKNFKKWSEGAEKAITANTNALALLTAPQGASSIIPINPLTKEPYYLDWAGDKVSVENIGRVPTRAAAKYTSTASKRTYAPSDQLVPVKVARGQVYRWVAWTHSTVANSSMILYLRDPATGTGSKATTHDEESKTSGHSPHGLYLRGIPSGWNKVSGTITFQDEISSLEFYSVAWNFSNISSGVTQYIAGFDIAPDVPSQAQVDDAQFKAIESLRILTEKQGEWSEGAEKAIQANTDAAEALARINGIQVGGRNLLRDSDVDVSNKDYLITRLTFGDSKPNGGEEVTLSLKGKLGSGVDYFAAYNSNGNGSSRIPSLDLRPEDLGSDGVYRRTGTWKDTAGNSALNLYTYPSDVKTTTTVDWVKLERGNQATDWSPAPEDLPTQKQVDDAQNDAIKANTSAIKALGKVALGDSLITFLEPSDEDVQKGNAKYDTPAWTAELLYINPDTNESFYNRFPGTTPIWRNQHKEVSEEVFYTGSKETVAVNDQVEYKWSMWVNASVPPTRFYVTMEDETGNAHIIESGSHVTGNPKRMIYMTVTSEGWTRHEGTFKFVPGTKFARVDRITVNPTFGSSEGSWLWVSDLQIHPNIPDPNVVNLLQEEAILENTTVGKENKKAIDALTEGLEAYAAAADLEELHKNIQGELEIEQDERAKLSAEINDLLVESIPRTIVYGSGPQFNDHILAEKTKITAKGTWVGQMLLDVTYVSKSDGTQTRRVIRNYNVPDTDGSREYSVPSASFGGYVPAYRLDYWIYRGKSIQKALSNSGSYITGSSFTKNSWTRIASHSIKKSNGAVHIIWRTRLTRADRGVTYSFDVRVNGKSVLDKHYKGYGPLTSFGNGGATLSFSGNLSVPDNGKIEIYAKANGTTNQARVSSNKGTLTYLELE